MWIDNSVAHTERLWVRIVMNETTRKRLTLGAVLFIGAVGLFGCKGEAGSSAPRPIPEVQVVEITSQTVPDEPEFIGQAEASSIVEIRPLVTGIIKRRFFSEGRDVKHCDRLYEIDPVPLKAAFASAKGRVAQTQARVVQAKQNLARLKPLLVEDAVSQKDVDDAIAEDLAARLRWRRQGETWSRPSSIWTTRSSWPGVAMAREQAAAQERQVNALKTALRLANLRYKGGLANHLDVLIAQRSLFDAELALATTRRLYLTSVVQLYKALGGGWSPDGQGQDQRTARR